MNIFNFNPCQPWLHQLAEMLEKKLTGLYYKMSATISAPDNTVTLHYEPQNETMPSIPDDVLHLGTPDLPVATASKLGGVKVGDNIEASPDGKISVPVAKATTAGVVKVGSGLNVDSTGKISGTTASTTIAGVGKAYPARDALDTEPVRIDNNGTFKYQPYKLPPAKTTVLGGVSVGDNIEVTPDGEISVPDALSGKKGVVRATVRTKPSIPGAQPVYNDKDHGLWVNDTVPIASYDTPGGFIYQNSLTTGDRKSVV